ncbi:hypothetical protein [Dyadobacter fermentans]|uniref:hypothetical protein n=1 Tax=Dyadobacter fermentans TaxID=94254 RepID=UPI001CBE0BE4|nr:hypothetical protein [Dyadobacter fermentans]MBZ1363040.1 hypothetical protein [Dyadobacter fermentans]
MIKEFDSIGDAERGRIEDVLYTASKFGLNFIPVAGPFLSELLGFMFANPVEARRSTFINDLSDHLQSLAEKGLVTMEDLKSNEDFMNVVVNAIPMALRAFEDDKRVAFRNAILNTAAGHSPDETKTQIFLRTLGELTITHIEVLYYFCNPAMWYQDHNMEMPTNWYTGSLQKAILHAYPKYSDSIEILDIVWEDLKRYGFHTSGGLRGAMTGDGCFQPRASLLGQEFMGFITFKDQ